MFIKYLFLCKLAQEVHADLLLNFSVVLQKPVCKNRSGTNRIADKIALRPSSKPRHVF